MHAVLGAMVALILIVLSQDAWACRPALPADRLKASKTSFIGKIVEVKKISDGDGEYLLAKVNIVRVLKGAVPKSIYVRGPKFGGGRQVCPADPDELSVMNRKQMGFFFDTPSLDGTIHQAPEVRYWFSMQAPTDDWVPPVNKRSRP